MTHTIEKLAETLGFTLKQRALKIASAESCTGGGVSYWITSIPGSSNWFDRGFITYSNSAKVAMLNVSNNTLQVFGAVSEETAREMAEGALLNSDAAISIAVTGIAGPDGGTPLKPVGTVWIAYAAKNQETKTFMRIFSGNRQAIREQTIITALKEALLFIDNP